MDANEYGKRLLADREFMREEYREYVGRCYMLPELAGDISHETLAGLIRRAKWDRRVRWMLAELLWHIDGRNLPDGLFRALMAFPKRTRRNYCGTLAHLKLPFYQMWELNRHCSEFESFAWLVNRICESEMFAVEDLLQVLRESKRVTKYGMDVVLDLARKRYGDSAKLEAAREWVQKNKNDPNEE